MSKHLSRSVQIRWATVDGTKALGLMAVLIALAACADHALAPNDEAVEQLGFEMTVTQFVDGAATRAHRLTADGLPAVDGGEPEIQNLEVAPLPLADLPALTLQHDGLIRPPVGSFESEVLFDEEGVEIERLVLGSRKTGVFLTSQGDELRMLTTLRYDRAGRVDGFTHTIYVDENTTLLVAVETADPTALAMVGAFIGRACAALGPQPLAAVQGCFLDAGDLGASVLATLGGAALFAVCGTTWGCLGSGALLAASAWRWLSGFFELNDCYESPGQEDGAEETRVLQSQLASDCTLFFVQVYVPGNGWVTIAERKVGNCA